MKAGVDFAHIASLVAEQGRATMLALLMDGRAHTTNELATAAGVARSTASGHLARLEASPLLSVATQGRHRYFHLASMEVAAMLGGLIVAAGTSTSSKRSVSRVPTGLCDARTCYDHMAGRFGVALADALLRSGAVVVDGETAALTSTGLGLLKRLGVRSSAVLPRGRIACRLCLDWSERRWHLAGALGASLLTHALEHDWLRRGPGGRKLEVTARGEAALSEILAEHGNEIH